MHNLKQQVMHLSEFLKFAHYGETFPKLMM